VKGAHGPLGVRPIDVGLAVVVLIAVELSVATGSGPGAAPLDTLAYVLGGIMVLPVLLRNRWPRFELIACSVRPRRCCRCRCMTRRSPGTSCSPSSFRPSS